MKNLLLFALFLFVACSTLTRIDTEPSGAKAYINGQFIGKTPVTKKLSNLVLNNYLLELKLNKYEKYTISLSKEIKAGPLIGGLCCLWPCLGWCYGPQMYYKFELQEKNDQSLLILENNDELCYYLNNKKINRKYTYIKSGQYSLKITKKNNQCVELIINFEPKYQYKLTELM